MCKSESECVQDFQEAPPPQAIPPGELPSDSCSPPSSPFLLDFPEVLFSFIPSAFPSQIRALLWPVVHYHSSPGFSLPQCMSSEFEGFLPGEAGASHRCPGLLQVCAEQPRVATWRVSGQPFPSSVFSHAHRSESPSWRTRDNPSQTGLITVRIWGRSTEASCRRFQGCSVSFSTASPFLCFDSTVSRTRALVSEDASCSLRPVFSPLVHVQ